MKIGKRRNKVRNIAGCVEVNACFLATSLHLSVAISFSTGFEETRSLPLFTVNYCSVLSNFESRSSCYCRKCGCWFEGRLPQVWKPLDVTRRHFHKACSCPSSTTFGCFSWRLSFYTYLTWVFKTTITILGLNKWATSHQNEDVKLRGLYR